VPDRAGRCSVGAMCAACVAQGVAYVGGALAGLQVMAARASAKRRRNEAGEPASDAGSPIDQPERADAAPA
jgi:hypothetical protein